MTIIDEKSALIVTPDRSIGGTSLVENQIEVMIHRRTLKDDETVSLNNSTNARGKTLRGQSLSREKRRLTTETISKDLLKFLRFRSLGTNESLVELWNVSDISKT